MFKNLFSKRAIFDETRTYRYVLIRKISSNLPAILFIMLNPSIADEHKDDPTIRRVIGFAKLWGYGIVLVMNLFAFRSTNPSLIKEVKDPIGKKNDYYLKLISGLVSKIIVAWGTNGKYLNRANNIMKILPKKNKLYCLEKTKDGHPRHPLYVQRDVIPQPFGWETSGEYDSVIRDKITLMNFMT